MICYIDVMSLQKPLRKYFDNQVSTYEDHTTYLARIVTNKRDFRRVMAFRRVMLTPLKNTGTDESLAVTDLLALTT